MLRLRQCIIVCSITLTFPSTALALTIQVPSQQPTIQAAINAATNGDTVLVAPGTYVENINFLGKAIKVMSQSGPAVTIIDGNQADSVVIFSTGEGPASELSGFTVRNGSSMFDGGGIRIGSSSPTITGNVITQNKACNGLGIAVNFGSPVIQMNTISHNMRFGCTGGTGGGGILVGGNGSAQIVNNTITENVIGADGGGIALFAAGTPTIRANFITKNTSATCGGGISLVNQSDALIVGNVITGNSTGCGGGVSSFFPGFHLINNTIAGNNAGQGSGIYVPGSDGQTEIVNNIVIGKTQQTAIFCDSFYGNNHPIFRFNNVMTSQAPAYGGSCPDQTGINGNISTDPLFVAPAQDVFRLNPDSPSIDAGDNAAPSLPATDIAGAPRIADGDSNGSPVIDMGAYEFAPNPGALQFSAATYSTLENSGPAHITVTRRGGKTGTVTLDFGTVGGTATGGTDYAPTSGILTFLDGDFTDKTFNVTIFDDALPEPSETIALQLSNPTGGAVLGAISMATVTIFDDETVADLALTKADNPDPAFVTGRITYTLKVTNNGPALATGVILTDPLPITTLFFSASASQGTCSGFSTITCSLGTIPVGAMVTVTIVVTAITNGIINTATVSGNELDPVPGNNSATQATTTVSSLASAPYFPLVPGMTWTYAIDTGSNFTVTVLPTPVPVNGVLTTVIHQSDTGQQDFYTNDANGIRQHAQFQPNVPTDIGPLDIMLTFIPPIQIANPQVTNGQTIVSNGIAQTNPLPSFGVLTFGYSASVQIQGIETVTVPAGTFDALRIQANLTISGDTLTSTNFLAKGIGTVKDIDSDGTSVLTGFTVPLSVTKTGSGTVTSTPGGLACGATCQIFFPNNTAVTLHPVPAPGATFAGWSGDPDCSDGQVTMTTAKSCTAMFATGGTTGAAKLGAISTRSAIQAVTEQEEGNAMIAGFVISGTTPKTVVIRARGPSLTAFGVQGALTDPLVKVLSGQTTLAQNDDWQVSDPTCANTGNQCGTAADITNAGLSPCSPNVAGCEKEAALYITLPPGVYTAIARGASGSPGIGLVEVYDVAGASSMLLAISTRGMIQAVNEAQEGTAMIAGFSVSGEPGSVKTVVIRARGPSLNAFDVPNALPDPFLKILSGQTTVAQNDDWQVSDPTCANTAYQCGTATDITNAGLSPCSPNVAGCEKEAAIHIRLAPGAYTAIARGASGTPGIGLIEVFDVGN